MPLIPILLAALPVVLLTMVGAYYTGRACKRASMYVIRLPFRVVGMSIRLGLRVIRWAAWLTSRVIIHMTIPRRKPFIVHPQVIGPFNQDGQF